MPANPIILAEIWEAHKTIILDLWKQRKLPPTKLSGVMRQQHGFVASKAQYEHQFRKWGISKNRAGGKWKYISKMITRRSGQGKSSMVLIDGEKVDQRKLRKETRRYDIPRVWSRPSTPEPIDGIEILTPEASPSASLYALQEQQPEAGSIQANSTERLSYVKAERVGT